LRRNKTDANFNGRKHSASKCKQFQVQEEENTLRTLSNYILDNARLRWSFDRI